VHDFIQWWFPLPEASHFNPEAPLLTDKDVAAFRSEPVLRTNLLRSFERILAFLGLAQAADGRGVEGANFAARAAVWSYPSHNWLRITRILRSLRLLGLEDQARALYDRLELYHSSRRFPIPADTFRYWKEAVEGLPFHR
jgi:hypothetical protein